MLYFYEANTITTEPLIGSTGGKYIISYKIVHDRLSNSVFKTATHWMDSKAREALKNVYRKIRRIRIGTPHIHSRNAEE